MKAALNAFCGCLAALPAKFGRAAMRAEREIAKPVGVGVLGEREVRIAGSSLRSPVFLCCYPFLGP